MGATGAATTHNYV